MGVKEWFSRWFGSENGDGEPVDANPATAADPASAAARGAAVEDPIRILTTLPLDEAVTRTLSTLGGTGGSPHAPMLLAWLKTACRNPDLPAELRVRVADLFAERGEWPDAARALEPLRGGVDAGSLSATARLADFAMRRGDRDEARRWYEEILAADIGYPGVRERYMRLIGPARAGVAGATLLAPEATQLAHGRLELLRELGRGGAGAVFLARDTKAGRTIALKIYHPSQRRDRGARLRAEARVAAAINARHTVRVFELFDALGALSMEHCTGGSLRHALQRPAHPEGAPRAWLEQIALALAASHACGWIHRDLKPGNVLLRADDTAVLTDFGLACRIGETFETYEGTAGYVPPEVRDGAMADPRIDVYAFGAIVREFARTDRSLAALAERCTATDPADRPRDGEALFRALRG